MTSTNANPSKRGSNATKRSAKGNRVDAMLAVDKATGTGKKKPAVSNDGGFVPPQRRPQLADDGGMAPRQPQVSTPFTPPVPAHVLNSTPPGVPDIAGMFLRSFQPQFSAGMTPGQFSANAAPVAPPTQRTPMQGRSMAGGGASVRPQRGMA